MFRFVRCPLCDRCFGQQTNLDPHLKKHESDGPTILDEDRKRYVERSRNAAGALWRQLETPSAAAAAAAAAAASASSGSEDAEDVVVDPPTTTTTTTHEVVVVPRRIHPVVRSLSCEITIRTEKPTSESSAASSPSSSAAAAAAGDASEAQDASEPINVSE